MAVFTLDVLRELLLHMEWADAAVWRAVLAHPPAAEDRRIRDLLLHAHGAQRAFLQAWISSGPVMVPTLDGTAGLGSIQARVASYYVELAAVVTSFDEDSLRRPVEMPGLSKYEARIGRRFDKPTIAETMIQVMLHSTHHRGQVNARLREIGGEPPLVDYIAWVCFGRPPAEWAQDAGRRGNEALSAR